MKTILVTGATRGIGYATAKRLLQRGDERHLAAAQARPHVRVIALGRNFANFELDGPNCERLPFDLRDVDAIEALCARTVSNQTVLPKIIAATATVRRARQQQCC